MRMLSRAVAEQRGSRQPDVSRYRSDEVRGAATDTVSHPQVWCASCASASVRKERNKIALAATFACHARPLGCSCHAANSLQIEKGAVMGTPLRGEAQHPEKNHGPRHQWGGVVRFALLLG